jgi:hypothetical protein
MKRLLSILMLVVAGLAHAQEAPNAIPVYQQFPFLSALPWEAPGASRRTVLERIFREPDPPIRRVILREYLRGVLPVGEFPAAFDECITLEQADFPDDTAALVMREWAARDPAAALERCRALLDLIIEGAPGELYSWKEPLRPANPERVRASSYWFGGRQIAHAWQAGLDANADLPQVPRRELASAFTNAYYRRFQQYPPTEGEDPWKAWNRRYRWGYGHKPDTVASDPALRDSLLELLRTPPAEIAGKITWPKGPTDDPLYARALVRWMDGDATKAPRIVEQALDVYDPKRFYRGQTELLEIIPVEFLAEWARLDREGFITWQQKEWRGWRAQAVFRSLAPAKDGARYHDYSNFSESRGEEFQKLWLQLDPGRAMPGLQGQEGADSSIYRALDNLARSDSPANYWRAQIPPYLRRTECPGVNEAWSVTRVWAKVDFRGMVTDYGFPRCLCTDEFKREDLPGILTNRVPLPRDSGTRVTLSALRVWAVLRPAEMEAWITSSMFEAPLREALSWILKNAEGGFPLPPEKPKEN